jgi:hypothetical protein
MFINLKSIGGNMVKFNLVTKLIFLGVLVKFLSIPHAVASSDFGDRKSSEIVCRGRSSSSEVAIIDKPDAIFTSGMSTEKFLEDLSKLVNGNAMEPSQESTNLHRQILDGIVRYAVSTLNTLTHETPESRVLVGKLINFWLLHRNLPAGCNWLNFVEDENGKKLLKNEAIKYLIGEKGVVTLGLTSISERLALIGSRRGTTLLSLTELFCTASANFEAALRSEKGFVQEQRNLLAKEAGPIFFAGGRQKLSLFDVLDAALTRAAIEQQSARGDIARISEKLESHDRDIAKLQGQMDVMFRYADTLLRRPVTYIIYTAVGTVAYSWSWVPFHGTIENICGYLPYNGTIKNAVMGIPVLGDALSSVKKL